MTMGSILNENDRSAIVNRMRSLSVSSTGRWGTMDVTAMLKHLSPVGADDRWGAVRALR